MISPTRLQPTRRGRLVIALVAAAALASVAWVVAGAADRDPVATATPAANPSPSPSPSAPAPDPVAHRGVDDGAHWVEDDPAVAVVTAAEGVLARAPVVVVAASDVLEPAVAAAARLRAPLVPADADGLDGLLARLGTVTVVDVVDGVGDATATPEPPRRTGVRDHVVLAVDGDDLDLAPLDEVAVAEAPQRTDPVVVLVRPDDPALPWLQALARAAGTFLVPVTGELAADPAAIARLRALPDASWGMAGTASAWEGVDRDVLGWDVAVARRGVELPGGGLRLFPGRRLVALYGSPGAASLGVLGEQPVDAAVSRARELAAPYAALVDEPVVPTFEIITTVASRAAGPQGDYSTRVPLERIEPWVDAAEDAGMYVVLDLQPGRTDFLTQAKELEPLLRRPHVGLALDPEWRLAPDQVHLRQVGSVSSEEVQAVADWLADLTRREALPHKLLLLHQFTLSMIQDRAQLRPPPELAVVIQMDGQGSQGAKDATWASVTADAPPGVRFGWKNFYDEDTVLRSPEDTLGVDPSPVLVSYQ